MTKTKNSTPDFLFETSWEVCNKVGGIYTVLSTRANTLLQQLPATTLAFIGPELGQRDDVFMEDILLLTEWKQAAEKENLRVRIGRWNVPGQPIAVLVDFQPYFEQKNEIYAQAWELFHVDSMRAYGDYDEASMFSYAAGRFAEAVVKHCLKASDKVVYQAHEWMSGLGMLFLGRNCPQVATIFTTHATSIGRSIAGNNKLLYEYFEGYNGDQMAAELSMEAKHSIEKQSAHLADCFTTVSNFTDRECRQLLDKAADVVLPNGFELDFVPKAATYSKLRREVRRKIIQTATALTGDTFDENTLIISTSGRNDFRCKGFDVYLEAMRQLRDRLKDSPRKVISLIEVPCWLLGPRKDLQQRLHTMQDTTAPAAALETPMITHDLYNLNEDRILCLMKDLGLTNKPEDKVKVILIPCYLDGKDGILNISYYDMLTANDLTVYPSYYEPWGYTPLESVAFKTPCITTDLSGFGQWVNEVLDREGTIEDGVAVLHRDDRNYQECAAAICDNIEHVLHASHEETDNMRRNASKFATKAQWKNFIRHYYKAYEFALSK